MAVEAPAAAAAALRRCGWAGLGTVAVRMHAAYGQCRVNGWMDCKVDCETQLVPSCSHRCCHRAAAAAAAVLPLLRCRYAQPKLRMEPPLGSIRSERGICLMDLRRPSALMSSTC